MGMLAADAAEQHHICLPLGADMNTAIKSFVAGAANEKDKSVEGLAIMLITLYEGYPCKK